MTQRMALLQEFASRPAGVTAQGELQVAGQAQTAPWGGPGRERMASSWAWSSDPGHTHSGTLALPGAGLDVLCRVAHLTGVGPWCGGLGQAPSPQVISGAWVCAAQGWAKPQLLASGTEPGSVTGSVLG